MGNSTAKLSLALLLLVSVWVAAYWLYEPRRAPVTIDPEPAPEQPDSTHAPDEAPAPPVNRAGPASAGVVPPEFIRDMFQPEDTLESIAGKFSVSVEAITRANPLMSPDRMGPGREILIPKDPTNIQGRPLPPKVHEPRPPEPAPGAMPAARPPAPEPAPAPVPKAPPSAPAFQEYTVQPGDTLSGISKRFYGSVQYSDRIYEANKDRLKSPDDLGLGQKLRIPPKPD